MRQLIVTGIFASALAFLAFSGTGNSVVHAEEVSSTQQVRLGFDADFPISANRSDSVCLGVVIDDTCVGATASYSLNLNGTANIVADMGADITLTYDREDLVPGGSVPVEVTYTPTNSDVSPDVDLDASATLTVDFTGCLNCPADLNLTLAAGSADFVAPMNADPAINIPLSSSSVTLSAPVLGDLIEAHLEGNLQLAPASSGAFPGLGGAASVLNVSGANLTSPAPIPVLEWQNASQTLAATVELPPTPGASADVQMATIVHWLDTSGNLTLVMDLLGLLDIFPEPDNIALFSGSLGPAYQDLGLDTQIGDAVSAAITAELGFDPGVGSAVEDRIAAGFIPIPLLEPEIDSLGPATTPTLGSRTFSIDLDSDDDGLLDGEEIAIGTDPDNPDTDGDGLTDGDEVNVHGTDPLDADTDDDGLTDGDEVNVHGTDPLDPDTDDDECSDGEEVNVIGTDPLDPDTDDDGLTDCLEVALGTDPLDSDTDDDGIPDGQDAEFVQAAIENAPDEAFKSTGHGLRTAMLRHLDNIERAVARGDVEQAIDMLEHLRRRVDGCGTSADQNDWVVDCPTQIEIRELIDLLITNLSP